ncbi:efflux RND transporter periplasmic adaptor subunit [Algoriphagus kandeliae]|uniref:Efflux RND transporter periplasmic adaptor subunit n=1 Tax=Algoriphagus kandeliae TaxID=2562278 RepID=A0A4Y9R1K5_9BACT|nr:efflux RND transporter periplasmic adaptor subunit [Algoriphagus kandeliae]TFV97423.1 efflux RND transporter periplasmic adaptor subunit [Algoriphagus kandeliae]
MKKLLSNKWIKIAGILVLGIGIGWLIKPSSESNPEADHDHAGELASQIWTCSMHPQIKLNEPGDCPICGMDLIPLSAASSSQNDNPLVFEMSPQAAALANISTTLVGGNASGGQVTLTGKIQADERENAAITAKFPGRIEKLYVTFTGEKVRAGQKLASIYSPELLTAQQELIEAAKSKDRFPELYQAAKEKLRLWKLSESQISQIEATGQPRDQIDIVAEHSGVVLERKIAVGDYVSTGSVLFNIVDLSKLWVLLDAYESDLPFLSVGNEVSFTVAGLPGETFKAQVSYIDPLINPSTRAASVRAEVSNSQEKLKPEMFVTAILKSKASSGSQEISIPRTSILWSGKRSVVYVKVPGSEVPAFEMREITLGSKVGDSYQVEAGIQAGEEIVSNGVFAIDAAAQLSGQFSMMNRPETKTIDVSPEFRAQITRLADAYFELKNALVADEFDESLEKAKNTQSILNQVDMNLFGESAHDEWMQVQNQLKSAIERLQTAENLEKSRLAFAGLSEGILEMTERFGLDKEVVYKDYCPMAFGDQGAYWLSERKDITNPYFGASMLTCGEVKQTYLKGQPVLATQTVTTQISTTHNH